MPCGGTGQVISNLGGAASKVTCPWCSGERVRQPDIDAQARWLHPDGTDAAEADSPGESSPEENVEEAS